MADRDYRVSYKSREIDRDDDRYGTPRKRIPTALDPYEYPEDREQLKRGVAETRARNARYRDDVREYESPVRRETTRDDVTSPTVRDAGRPSATKTTYAVTNTGLEKESEISMARGPSAASRGGPAPSESRTTFRERDEYDAVRVSSRPSDRPYDDRGYKRAEGAYDTSRPRREGGAYVVDMRDADIVDIRTGTGARESDRGFAGYRNDPYDAPPRASTVRERPRDDYKRSETVYVDRDEVRGSTRSLQDAPYMSGARQDRAPTAAAARSQTDFRGPTRTSTRIIEDDRASTTAAPYGPSRQSTRRDEDEFAFIEKTTTRDRAPTIRESFRDPFEPETPRGRTTAAAYTTSPPDDYVMVSPPPQDSGRTGGSQRTSASMRSALVDPTTYPPEERLRRRRSRSCNFRDEDVSGHYAGEKFHERPGAEAAMMGRYLKHYDVEDEQDQMDFQYSSRNGGRRSERDVERYDERKEVREYDDSPRYAPQRIRSRSRGGGRGRRYEDEDDRSYVDRRSEKTTKTTYY